MKAVLLSIVLCAAMAASAAQSCGSDTCASDELCGSSGTACQCNSALYSYTGAHPSPVISCDGGKLNIKLSKCVLERNGYNSSNIRLQNNTCLATKEINGTAQMAFHRPLSISDCGTTATVNSTHITYQNQLYVYAKTFPITTRQNVVMGISCSLPLNTNISLNVTLRPISGNTVLSVPGSTASYKVFMVAYKDPDFTVSISESDIITIEDTIYIAVFIPDLDAASFQLKVLSMYASPYSGSSIKYNLLTNGCPSTEVPPDLMKVKKNGQGIEARFEMKVFKIADSDSVSLSADIFICSNCVPGCISPGKSARTESSLGTVSILLTASDSYVDTSSASSSSWSLSALIFSWILMKLM